MDAELSDDQEMLRASVRRFLSERAPIGTYVRAALDATSVGHDPVWDGLADLGVVGLMVPEAHGGAGRGMVDAAVVLEELGRAVCPAPFLSSAIGAVCLVSAAGGDLDRAALLPRLADGSAIGTVAWMEPDRRYAWTTPSSAARRGDGGWILDGAKAHVADAEAADLLLVVAAHRDGGPAGPAGLGVFVVEAEARGLRVTPTPGVDGTRKEASVELDGVPATRLGHDAGPSAAASAAIGLALDRMMVASVIDGVGAASRALELAVEYAKERVQFERPIGAFQAVQHLCADMLRAVELGRAAGYYACWAADAASAEEARRAAALAKAYASDAFAELGGTAIQVFGGVGFTWEHDIHLFYKRLLSVSVMLGGTDEHLAALADLVL
jgi:alkylation response protein AidB-like acyl-CoA dehydrogenase